MIESWFHKKKNSVFYLHLTTDRLVFCREKETGFYMLRIGTNARFIPRFSEALKPLKARKARVQFLAFGEVQFTPDAEKAQSSACNGKFGNVEARFY